MVFRLIALVAKLSSMRGVVKVFNDSMLNKLHLGDCTDFMKSIPTKYFEVAIVDP